MSAHRNLNTSVKPSINISHSASQTKTPQQGPPQSDLPDQQASSSITLQYFAFLKGRNLKETTLQRHLRALKRIQESYNTRPELLSIEQVRNHLPECKKIMPLYSYKKHFSGLSMFYRKFLQRNMLAFDKFYLAQPQVISSDITESKFQNISNLRQRMIEDMILAGLSQKTQDNYIRQIQAVQKHFGKHPFRITDEELRAYLLWLRDTKNVAKGTFQPALAALRMFYLHTLGRETKVLDRVGKPRQKRLPKAFSDAEIKKLFAAIKKNDIRLCCQCMYMLGARINEAVKISISDINSTQMTIRIIGKRDKERDVPLPQVLLSQMRNLWKVHKHPRWLFPNRWGKIYFSDASVRTVMKSARTEIGLSDELTPHTLRHSYATRLTEAGVPLEVVRVLMGHSSIKSTQIYLHLTEPIKQQTQQKVNEVFTLTDV